MMPASTAVAMDRRTPIYGRLYAQVLVAIAAGIALGHFYLDLGASMKPLGDVFIKLVKLVIAPVIFLTVTLGIAGVRDLLKWTLFLGPAG